MSDTCRMLYILRYIDGFITSVKGIYGHAQLSVDWDLVAERDQASGG